MGSHVWGFAAPSPLTLSSTALEPTARITGLYPRVLRHMTRTRSKQMLHLKSNILTVLVTRALEGARRNLGVVLFLDASLLSASWTLITRMTHTRPESRAIYNTAIAPNKSHKPLNHHLPSKARHVRCRNPLVRCLDRHHLPQDESRVLRGRQAKTRTATHTHTHTNTHSAHLSFWYAGGVFLS